jgi:hypothetical protein
VEIVTVAWNNNPLEMRRMLDLYLEVKDPGHNEYRRVNSWPEKIQTNDYSEKANSTLRTWTMLPSFIYLKNVGEAKLRVNISDGVNKWSTASYSGVKPPYYSELVFNITNSMPNMSSFELTPSGLVRYNDPIEFKSIIEDKDGDMLNVTLHILDENGNEVRNETINTKPGPVSFKANEYGFFAESDSGKNFTYYYSYDDGIGNVSRDPEVPLKGPNIKKGAKLSVDRLDFTSSSENYYWWDKYGFSVRAKNLNPEEYEVSFTLSTRTGEGEWITVETKNEKIGPDPVVVRFNRTEPFKVTDAGKTFYYRVKYSEYDQTGNDAQEMKGAKINRKIVPFAIHSGTMVLNIFLMLFIVTMIGFYMERSLKKGVEAHEHSSSGADAANPASSDKSSQSIADSIARILRRR